MRWKKCELKFNNFGDRKRWNETEQQLGKQISEEELSFSRKRRLNKKIEFLFEWKREVLFHKRN